MLDKSEIPAAPVILRNSICLIIVSIRRYARHGDFPPKERTHRRRTREAISSIEPANYPSQSQRGPHVFRRVDPLRDVNRRKKTRGGKRVRRFNGITKGRIMQIGSNYPLRSPLLFERRSLARISSLDVPLDVDVGIARASWNVHIVIVARCFLTPYYRPSTPLCIVMLAETNSDTYI